MESDENKTIARMILEDDFRTSLAANLEKTISDAGYNVSSDFIDKLKGMDISSLGNQSVKNIESTLQDLGYARTW